MSFLHKPQRRQQPFLLLQSSIAQSGLGIIRQLLNDTTDPCLLFCLLHSPLLSLRTSHVHVHDLLDNIPGYNGNYSDSRQRIQAAVENAPLGPLDVFIDSVDTLVSDVGSVSEIYKFLYQLLNLIRSRPDASRLILHVVTPSPLISLLCQPAFSSSLTACISHPSSLLLHLSVEYLTLPPPLSPEAKFWGIFLPISERGSESERLIFGVEGEGAGDNDECVLEIVVRGDGEGVRRRGVERTLHGWSVARGICSLSEISDLKGLFSRPLTESIVLDPTHNVPFNLNLTASQQNSRAQVPLPYVHEGKPSEKPAAAAIFYDPDSADDIDDDDPDEDLDI